MKTPSSGAPRHLLPQAGEGNRRVLLGVFGAPHGVKGEVRLKSFTADPLAIRDYGALSDETGRAFHILAARDAGEVVVVRLRGFSDRTAVEALNGVELYVARDKLGVAEEEDEFLHADLVGLEARAADGARLGPVRAVLNFGGGDLLEVVPERGPTLLFPFTKAVVPTVDLAGGFVVIAPPDEVEGEEGSPHAEEQAKPASRSTRAGSVRSRSSFETRPPGAPQDEG